VSIPSSRIRPDGLESVRKALQGSEIPQILLAILNGTVAKAHAGLAEQVGRVAANYGAENGKPHKPANLPS